MVKIFIQSVLTLFLTILLIVNIGLAVQLPTLSFAPSMPQNQYFGFTSIINFLQTRSFDDSIFSSFKSFCDSFLRWNQEHFTTNFFTNSLNVNDGMDILELIYTWLYFLSYLTLPFTFLINLICYFAYVVMIATYLVLQFFSLLNGEFTSYMLPYTYETSLASGLVLPI